MKKERKRRKGEQREKTRESERDGGEKGFKKE